MDIVSFATGFAVAFITTLFGASKILRDASAKIKEANATLDRANAILRRADILYRIMVERDKKDGR